MTFISVLPLFTMSLYLSNLILLVVLHLKSREYTFIKNAVSDFGVGSTKGLFTIYIWMGNFAAVLLAAIFYLMKAPSFPHEIPALLLSMIICRIGVAVFPTDIEGKRMTLTGILHYLFAIGTFALSYIVINKVNDALVATQGLVQFKEYLVCLGYIIAVSLSGVVITMFKPLHILFPIFERIFLTTIGIWFLSISGIFFAISSPNIFRL